MFLDDQLYNEVKNTKIETREDLKKLIASLHRLSEDYYMPKVQKQMGYKEITALLDKTFKFWDMFVIKLKKENHLLTDYVESLSFKHIFLMDENKKRIYEQGKN